MSLDYNIRHMKKKVAMAMSGGVDSSVSAYLLKKEGYDLTGVFMHCWPQTGWPCTEDRDRADALKVAEKLKIPFLVWDFEKEYRERVMDYFYKEYKAGRTPNPDSYCNREIKFGLFLERAFKELKVDFIATGHYARVAKRCNLREGYTLLKGIDDKKDQSYFLYTLGQYELFKTLFPVGEMLKNDVRNLAKKIGLSNFDKKGTSGICFVGKVNIKDFLKKEISEKEGNVIDIEGNIIGRHIGVWFYTIGQRHGFTINAKHKWAGLPLYVVDKNINKNELVVGWGEEAEKKEFFVSDINWINPKLIANCELRIKNLGVRIRHLGEIYKCKIKINDKVLVELEEGVRGISSGQNAVFYDGEVCLGGGVIS